MQTDAEVDCSIGQSEWLARILIRNFDGLPAAMVMNALGIVIGYAVAKLSTNKDLDATMALLREVARLEIADPQLTT